MWLYRSAQYSVYLVGMSWASARQLLFLSRMVLACPCFRLVKTFNSWYAFLLMFLMLSTVPWQCTSIQDSLFPFFVIFLISWFITLTFFCPFPLSHVSSSSVSFALHKDSMSAVTHGRFFDCSAFGKNLASFSVVAVLTGSSTSRMVTGAYYAFSLTKPI